MAKFCSNCGTEVREDQDVCLNCGCKLNKSQESDVLYTSKSGKSKLAAGLFGIFLGGIGVHNFYMGKIGRGVLDIVFCWTGIPAIIGFVMGIIYLVESDEQFEKRFN